MHLSNPPWRTPKFLVRPKKGSTMSNSGSSWNLVSLPAFNIKERWEGRAESSGIILGRGTSYLVIRSCIQNQSTSWLKLILHTLGVKTSHMQPWTHLTHHSPDSGKPPPSPYNILCVSPPHLHPNGTFSRDSQSGVPKLSRFGLPGLWAFITSRSNLRLGQSLKKTCSSPWELFNGVSHFTWTHRDWVDSRLLVVGSQTASLTPGPSFAHNLGCRCPNCQCEGIFDIYTSRPFQQYEKHFNAKCFDPCNRILSFRESRKTPKSHFRECEWQAHTSLKVGLRHTKLIPCCVIQF